MSVAHPVLSCPSALPPTLSVQPGDTISLGSGEDVTWRLTAEDMAEERAWITYNGEELSLIDLEPTDDLRVNGNLIGAREQLKAEDVIEIGGLRIAVQWGAEGLPVPPAAPAILGETSRVVVTGEKAVSPSLPEVPGKPALSLREQMARENQAADDEENHVKAANKAKVKKAKPLLWRGQEVREVPVHDGLTFGRSDKAEVTLADASVSSLHARVTKTPAGFVLHDEGRNPSRANGGFFSEHELVFGDFIQIGVYHFIFTGFSFERVSGASGCGISAAGVIVRKANGEPIIADASFVAPPGSFVGILGPSGAGKTTLMRAVAGLVPITDGHVRLNGREMHDIGDLSTFVGFVPQQDIVHHDLTARQAIRYNALLRLPAQTSQKEIESLIAQLAGRLGLGPHLDTRIARLSGGQLKRVNVCVELLNRPTLLFLDEPTSGLDPAAELDLMRLLQELSATGCTVVCTTHLMERVYLMDSIEVVAAKRGQDGKFFPGHNVFRGRPRLAKDFFGVENLSDVYLLLREKEPAAWRADFQKLEAEGSRAEDIPDPSKIPDDFIPRLPRRRRPPLWVLLARQWDLLKADGKNLWLLLGQPLLVALLIAFVSASEYADSTKLFLLYIATLWFGSSNAAQEIVKEKAIFERERYTGLPPGIYLASKFLSLSMITLVQSLLMLTVVALFAHGLGGFRLWQIASLSATSVTSVALGLLISSWAQTRTQAVLLVPLVVIPQILFAGFVYPLKDWKERPAVAAVARLSLSFHAQRLMDTAMVWGKRVPSNGDITSRDFRLVIPLQNLEQSLVPWRAAFSKTPFITRLNETGFYRFPPTKAEMENPPPYYGLAEQPGNPLSEKPPFNGEVEWPLGASDRFKLPVHYNDKVARFQTGRIFSYANPALLSLATMLGMTFLFLVSAWAFLRKSR